MPKTNQISSVSTMLASVVGFAILASGDIVKQLADGTSLTGLDTSYLDSRGLLTAFLMAFVVGGIHKVLIKNNVTLKMSERVPPNIAQTFKDIIPFAATTIVFWLFDHFFRGAFGFCFAEGVVHALSTKYPDAPAQSGDVEAARVDDMLNNQFLLEATFDGAYSARTLECATRLAALAGGALELLPEDLEALAAAAQHNDCLGINYYQSNFLKAYDGPNDCHHNSTGEKGTERHALQGIGEYVARPEIPRTDWDWMIYPQGLYDLVMRICRQWPHYKELYVTENGMASKDRLEEGTVHDEERIHYLREHLRWALKAIGEGANLRGYFVWSLMDVFSWNNGYNKRYGLFYVDFDTQERIPKDSARWYATLSTGRRLDG